MNTHVLKIWKTGFEAISSGRRTADVRINDRGFQVGDLILYRVWDPVLDAFDGNSCVVEIVDIVDNCVAVAGDQVVLSVKLLRRQVGQNGGHVK